MHSIIISIIGRDRPRMLAEIAGIIADEGGNIEDIRGHTMYIERGKKIANISMIVSGKDLGELYQKLQEKLHKFAEENNLIIQIYPIEHILGSEEEIIEESEED